MRQDAALHARDPLLDSYLKRLKMPTVARDYPKVAQAAGKENKSYEAFLLSLLETEVTTRESNAVKKRIAHAGFPQIKEIAEYDFTQLPNMKKQKVLQLIQCDYLQNRENIVFMGNHGTGKTHLAIALGIEACRRGHRVSYHTAASLVHQLIEARSEKKLLRLEKQIEKSALLIIDELGYVPLTQEGAQLLFGVLAQRYERASVIITTNLEFSEWIKVFAEEKLTAALLDRLTHRCQVFLMNGESYRFKSSQKRMKEAVQTATL
ncbi:IS21-like element helper ATPase IstB [Candidatus Manganitrophus noduliformans]|uniref:AAA family ATPase n=1 Tax=Candidatus Manganitrophus noduliformans TaxID=2606439 RepID=A0A7X6DUU7_9BACT|nr:IS21-like element helper ATPase IstB [Candidatus Manganitrophus noduliformans]NKE73828.1 AAA family ATPase [Candidatus Manganitrophus noduliformans]